jgi:transglutaminase-like putative cysteine protease
VIRRRRTTTAGPREPERRPGRAVALLLLAAATVLAWWSVLGAGTLWATPVVALAALTAAGRVPPRVVGLLLLAWVPASLLLAGVPLDALRPRALGTSASALRGGLDALTVPGRGTVVGDPWPLAGALLAAGITWCAAGLLARRPGRLPGVLALLLTSSALVGALALEQTTDAAWPGAVLLAAGILWIARGSLVALAPATAVVAVVAAVGAQAVGPDERWIPFVEGAGRKPAFTRLDTAQTYGPLTDRRTGAPMLEVTSPQPALWRMQVLERFDSRGWGVAMRARPDLPEPAAETVTSTVRIRGLRNRLLAAPGRIASVRADGGTLPDFGEARQLRRAPAKGDSYRVESSVVRVTAADIEDVRVPRGEEYDDYTSMWGRRYGRGPGSDGARRPAIDIVDRFRDGYGASDNPWYRTIELAARLARGTTSQLEIVRRVQNYLVGGDRFRYTTDVAEAGAQPILDFLLETREGYCQHFAGAAALLLRLAGVPTRVVTGFATGAETDDETYEVRDSDAHAWIEVYFPGYGWVAFNPTPAAAEATVAPETDVLAASAAGGAGGGGGSALLLLVPAAVVLAGATGLSRRRRERVAATGGADVGDLLARLAPGPVGPSTTLSALRPRLEAIGPEVAALAAAAEHARFSGAAPAPERHPRLRVWRALRRDLGTGRATVRMARAAGGRGAPGG